MDVTKAKISSIFFQYSIPSVLGMIAISSASIVDGFFIGNYVGDSGLAAINISLPIFSFLFGFALMLSVGSSVVSGKFIGEGKLYNASVVFSKTIISISLFSFLTCTVLFLNIKTLLHLLGANKELTVIAIEYLSVILIFIPFLMIGVVLDYFVRVDNRPNLAFVALLLSALINVILDWLMIVYLQKGIFGAALATGISQLTLLIILLPHFFSKRATLKFVKPVGNYTKIIKASYNGASEFVNEVSVGITTLIFNYVMIKKFDIEGIAAFTVINYLLMIGIMISFGISDSLQPIISKNFGAKKYARIYEFIKLAFISTSLVGIVMIIMILLLPETLANIFLEDDNYKTKQIVLNFTTFIWLAFLFNGVNLVISAYLTAMHKPLASMIIALSRSFIFPVFFIFTLPFLFDLNGIFMAIPMAEIITFIIAIILFRKFNAKNMDK
ncbi:MATE family efflux transporter [Malaciobacter molluscorum LMG 25693]|uniref:Multidrug export protein MepA n=1 Tax=Malaciobacter molluscorum LMG 25693 TaxID=870501 RepID=A0A2G1DLI8_9BACT|nr:MATE family efflux transporter [Malaciobacter molluscorum]AXX92146.1 MATE family efflux protein [Malaciobacter molluscorum LMG 25693]PHO19375.1 MATE family efflux transporter [Malaciobacter molluscorum LMG 25693]